MWENDEKKMILTNQHLYCIKGDKKDVSYEIGVPLHKVSIIVASKWLSQSAHKIIGGLAAALSIVIAFFVGYRMNEYGLLDSTIVATLSTAVIYGLSYIVLVLFTKLGIVVYSDTKAIISFKPKKGDDVLGIRQAIRSQQVERLDMMAARGSVNA